MYYSINIRDVLFAKLRMGKFWKFPDSSEINTKIGQMFTSIYLGDELAVIWGLQENPQSSELAVRERLFMTTALELRGMSTKGENYIIFTFRSCVL